MQATIMTVELRTGAAELTAVAVVAVHIPVAPDAHAELFGAGNCGRRNSYCRNSGDNQSKRFHDVSSNEKNKLTSKGDVPCFFMNGCSDQQVSSELSLFR